MTGEASLRVAKRLVEEFNRGGRAYNGGYYDYPEHKEKHLWPELKKLYYKPTGVNQSSRHPRPPIISPSHRSPPLLPRRRHQLRRRSQYRLHLRHRLPLPNRRRSAVY